MAVQKAYAIKDIVSGIFQAPFYSVNDATAIRSVQVACFDEQVPFASNPEDYQLWFINQYDNETGIFSMDETEIKMIANISTLKKQAEDKIKEQA